MSNFKQKYYLPFKQFVKDVVIFFIGNRRYEKVVIIGAQRTGSSMLLWLLRTHPEVELQGEIFRLLKGSSCKKVWQRNFGRKLPWIRYAGFKIFYYHPEDSDDTKVWQLIDADPLIRIIHIKRHNLLRSYVSKLIAEKTGAWNSNQEGYLSGPGDKRVTIDMDECLEAFREMKRYENDFGKQRFAAHPYMELTYEQLTGELQSRMNTILDFLGLKRIVFKSKLRRQNPEPMRDLVTNYDEVLRHLGDTEFSYLTEEDTIAGLPPAGKMND